MPSLIKIDAFYAQQEKYLLSSVSMYSKTTQKPTSKFRKIHFNPVMLKLDALARECINFSAFNLNYNSQQKQVINHPRKSTVQKTTSPRHRVVHDPNESSAGSGGGGGDDGNGPSGGGGDFGGGENDGDSCEEMFGTVLNAEDAKRVAEMRGIRLPSDMLKAAETHGIRSSLLNRYLDLDCLTAGMRALLIGSSCLMLSNLMGHEKRNAVSIYKNMLVGEEADIGMLAHCACMGPKPSLSIASPGHLELDFASLPSCAFGAETPGFKYLLQQRIATSFYKGIFSGTVGFGCGLIYQGTFHMLRDKKNSEEGIPVSRVLKSCRSLCLNRLEQLIQTSPLAKNVPPVALAFTMGI